MIDGIWTTPEIEIRGASYLLFINDLGDYRVPAMDVTIASLLGMNLPKTVCTKARRLNSQSEKSCSEYIRLLEASFASDKPMLSRRN